MKIIRIILFFVFGFLIFGCTRRKKAPEGLAGWLEKHFPDRFQILDTRTVDPIGNLSFQVKKSIVAEKTDSLLQMEIKWDKRDTEPDLSPEAIDAFFEQAKRELADARSLFEVLKTAGFSKASSSIRHGNAVVLIFEEPSPENRKRVLEALKKAFLQWPPQKNYGIGLIFMEPAAFQTEFGDIVPLAHWVRPDSWQSQKTIVSLWLKQGYAFDLRAMGKAWKFNSDSERLGKWLDQSQPIAERWAAQNLKKQVSFLPQTEFTALDGKLGIQFRFSFADGATAPENAEISGYIVGEWLLDKGEFENLRLEDK